MIKELARVYVQYLIDKFKSDRTITDTELRFLDRLAQVIRDVERDIRIEEEKDNSNVDD